MNACFLKDGDCFGYVDMFVDAEVKFWNNHFKKLGYSDKEILFIDLNNEFKKLEFLYDYILEKECSTD